MAKKETSEAPHSVGRWPSLFDPVEHEGIMHNERFYAVSDCRRAWAAREAWLWEHPAVVAHFEAECAVLHERYLLEYKAIVGVVDYEY
jgi:hypothetical protein